MSHALFLIILSIVLILFVHMHRSLPRELRLFWVLD